MTRAALDILIALPDLGTASAAAAALRCRGHRVLVASGAQVERAPIAEDVLVCDLRTLERLRESGQRAAAVLVDLEATPEAFRAALRLGASDVLTRPYLLSDLVTQIEAGARAERREDTSGESLHINVEAEADAIEDALRDLAAFLIARSVSPTTRSRVLSASAELLENVARHAFLHTDDARATLHAQLTGRELCVEVRDNGLGFDPCAGVRVEGAADTRRGGLARAEALSEDLCVSSTPGGGTRVTLRFCAYRVDFDEDDTIDLSELDWLPPGLARRVLESLTDSASEPLYNLSPALAVTVGRLLTGANPRLSAERAGRG